MEAKILLVILVSYLIGTAVAPIFNVSICYLVAISIIFILIGLTLARNKVILALILSVAALLLAIANYEYKTSNLSEIASHLEGKTATFIVVIDDIPTPTSFGQRVKVKIISMDGQSFLANVNLFAPKYPELKYGQKIKVEGKVSGFSETPGRYLKEGQVGSLSTYQTKLISEKAGFDFRYYLLRLRELFNQSVARSLPDSEASLAQGLIMGERAVFNDQIKTYLQNSGTTHIIALSGYNITIILGIFTLFRKYFSKFLNLIIPIIFIVLFIVMTGASASIVRAGIMGLMPILARYLGRGSQSLIAIILSATLMVAINPLILVYDIGFQLSFAAIAGVVYLSPKISFSKALPQGVGSVLSETLAAQIATLPIITYYFGTISLVSPIANVAILWLVPPAMLFSFLTGILGLVSSSISTIVALPANALLSLINSLIEFFGSLPYAAKALAIRNPVWILIYYLIVLDIFFFFKKEKRVRPT